MYLRTVYGMYICIQIEESPVVRFSLNAPMGEWVRRPQLAFDSEVKFEKTSRSCNDQKAAGEMAHPHPECNGSVTLGRIETSAAICLNRTSWKCCAQFDRLCIARKRRYDKPFLKKRKGPSAYLLTTGSSDNYIGMYELIAPLSYPDVGEVHNFSIDTSSSGGSPQLGIVEFTAKIHNARWRP